MVFNKMLSLLSTTILYDMTVVTTLVNNDDDCMKKSIYTQHSPVDL